MEQKSLVFAEPFESEFQKLIRGKNLSDDGILKCRVIVLVCLVKAYLEKLFSEVVENRDGN